MSEKEPKLPRLYDNCNNCEEDYDLTPDNCALFMYDAEPDCNYMYCHCPNCSSNFIMFIGVDTALNAVRHGIDPEVARFAPDKIKKARLDLLGIELVQPKKLTDRQEGYVHRLGEIVSRMSAHDLMEEMLLPNDYRPHNPRT